MEHKQIPLAKVYKDNSNLWMFSADLCRELRKCRWKKNTPKYSYDREVSYEEYRLHKEFQENYGVQVPEEFQDYYVTQNRVTPCDNTLAIDLTKVLLGLYSRKDTELFMEWLYAGKVTQCELAKKYKISQTLVSLKIRDMVGYVKTTMYSESKIEEAA